MNHDKKIQVVMLATDKIENSLWRDDRGYLLSNHNLIRQRAEGAFNHLYFLSDEEIKVGDWCINTHPYAESPLIKVLPNMGVLYLQESGYTGWFKIIATTNTELNSLKYDLPKDLIPRPSNSFIHKFVEEYNKGNVIEEVMVEYIEYSDSQQFYFIPKVASDNTITIKPVVETWDDIFNKYEAHVTETFITSTIIKFTDWLKENYNSPLKKR